MKFASPMSTCISPIEQYSRLFPLDHIKHCLGRKDTLLAQTLLQVGLVSISSTIKILFYLGVIQPLPAFGSKIAVVSCSLKHSGTDSW